MKKALKQGFQQGIEQGIEQGSGQAKLEIAKNLLKFLDPETVCRNTGLTLEEIQQLNNN